MTGLRVCCCQPSKSSLGVRFSDVSTLVGKNKSIRGYPPTIMRLSEDRAIVIGLLFKPLNANARSTTDHRWGKTRLLIGLPHDKIPTCGTVSHTLRNAEIEC